MNTLLLAPELFTTDSGIPRCLRLYLKALSDLSGENDRVRFVALNDVNIDSADLRPVTTDGTLDQWRACNRDKKLFIRSALALSSGVKLLICGHVAQLPVAWLARCRRPGLRYALVAHGIEVWRPFTFLERLALRGAWRVFCVSKFTRGELLSRIALDPARVIVLPNALDPTLDADTTAIPASLSPVILTVSRLSSTDRYKGIDHLIAAMPAILASSPAAKLRIVGRGDDRPRLHQLARDLGIDAAVEFAGYVDDLQLRHEFARCTLFALPSQKEGFGLVYLEAMAHGKPCIAAQAGGAPEVVTPGTGLLVPYGDIPALAAACSNALVRTWDKSVILARADDFSYSRFRQTLHTLINA
ncbi:MAG: glycosyltransferase family 4 protein [Opitutaceae bacterium]|nr:glycosyltransferase family 4 protein [Opitutaceae bacterium]